MAAPPSDVDDLQVDCISIKEHYDIIKKEMYKKHIILAQEKKTKNKVLLVRIKTDDFENIQKRKDYIRVLILMSRNHRLPGMVKFEKIIQDGLDVCLVQTFNEFGLLKDVMSEAFKLGKPYMEEHVKRWIAWLVVAVHNLHQRKTIHGNLHVANIYMDLSKLRVGPIEGFSRVLEDPQTFTGQGNIWKSNELDDLERANYMPPELIGGKMPGPASDIWCIGVIAHFMTTMTFPFQSSQPDRVTSKALKNNPSFCNFDNYNFSDELKLWIGRCLDKDPSTRPRSKDLHESPYLKDMIAEILQGDGDMCQQQRKA